MYYQKESFYDQIIQELERQLPIKAFKESYTISQGKSNIDFSKEIPRKQGFINNIPIMDNYYSIFNCIPMISKQLNILKKENIIDKEKDGSNSCLLNKQKNPELFDDDIKKINGKAKNAFPKEKSNTFYLRKRKRSRIKQNRYESVELILQNIKSNFFNTFLITKLNNILKKENPNLRLKKFPKSFVKNVRKFDNEKMLNMKLKEIFVNNELHKDKSEKNNKYNLEVIYKLDNDSTVLKMLNEKTYKEAYEEYLKSNDYLIHIDEIKKRHKDEIEYHEKFVALANRFLDYFSKDKNL